MTWRCRIRYADLVNWQAAGTLQQTYTETPTPAIPTYAKGPIRRREVRRIYRETTVCQIYDSFGSPRTECRDAAIAPHGLVCQSSVSILRRYVPRIRTEASE